MTTDRTLEEIAEKIAKLQAMTVENGATQGETEAAALMIAKLLTRYNITIEDAAKHRPRSAIDAAAIGQTWIDNHSKRRFEWEERLANGIGYGLYCKVLLTNVSYLFIGTSVDREIAINVFHRVRDVLSRLATDATELYSEYAAENGYNPREMRGAKSLRSYRLSFLNGATYAICEKLAAQRNAMDTADASAVKALIVRRDNDIAEYIDRQFGKLRAYRGGNTQYNDTAYRTGIAAGRNVSIGRADLTE